MKTIELTQEEQNYKKNLEKKLNKKINIIQNNINKEKLDIQNTAIKKINKLSIEYKYQKATQSMIHDWEKAQATSMLWALRFLGILRA